jgi:plasmid stabilization system protein ParE
MTYKLDIARTAKRDRDEAYHWYSENYSKHYADAWYLGIANAIESLNLNPERCAFAHENARLNGDVRQLLYGKSKKQKHRILFTIEENTVYVVRIRHSAQRNIEQDDLREEPNG